jgi:hypothetical protein
VGQAGLQGSRSLETASPSPHRQANGWIEWLVQPLRNNCIWFCRWPPTYTPARYALAWSILTADRIRTGQFVEPDRDEGGRRALAAKENDRLVVWGTACGRCA